MSPKLIYFFILKHKLHFFLFYSIKNWIFVYNILIIREDNPNEWGNNGKL